MNTNINKSLDEIAHERRRLRSRGGRGAKTRGVRRGARGGRALMRGGRKSLGRRGVPARPRDNRKRLYITNLSRQIDNLGLKKILSDFGKLTRCGVHFDKLGNSKGTADVEFQTHESARQAILKLNKGKINNEIVYVSYSNRPRITTRRNVTRIAGRGRKRTRGTSRMPPAAPRRGTRRPLNARGGSVKVRKFRNSLGRRRRN